MRIASLSALRPWLPAAGAIALSLFIAGFVWNQRQERYRNDMSADFAYENREFALRLGDRMTAYRQILRGGRSVLSTVGILSRAEWSGYVSNLFLNNDFPGIQGLGYAPRVKKDHLPVHLARVRTSAFPDYNVRPEGSRENYAPIARIEPFSGDNEAILGLDLLSNPTLLATMELSLLSAKTQLSKPVALASQQDAKVSKHVFMFQPIYDGQLISAESGQVSSRRQEAMLGWVFGVFRISELLRATLGPVSKNLSLKIFSGNKDEDDSLIYDSTEQNPVNWLGERPLRQLIQVDIDGQFWTLVFEGFPRAYTSPVMFGVFGGEFLVILLICTLFSLSAILITLTRQRSLRIIAMAHDLQESKERYQFLATHDALTKVANRFLFQDKLATTLAEAKRYDHKFGLIYIDLDHFKPVNDVLGHHIGDLLLISATQRLSELLRDSDLLARRGGDEFVVLLPFIDGVENVELVAGKICTALAQPFLLESNDVNISGSLGLSVYPEDGDEMEQLINSADHRMYLAKKRGRNCWVSHGGADDASE